MLYFLYFTQLYAEATTSGHGPILIPSVLFLLCLFLLLFLCQLLRLLSLSFCSLSYSLPSHYPIPGAVRS